MAFGQEIRQKNNNHLPSQNVYYIFPDSKGYLWFGTDKGVSKFNGIQYENYGVLDGLPDNDVFVIDEDASGRIWFGTYDAQLTYFEHDSIRAYEFNDTILKYHPDRSVKFGFHFEKDHVFIGDAKYGLVKIDSKGNLSQSGDTNRRITDFGNQLLRSRDGLAKSAKSEIERAGISLYHRESLINTYQYYYSREFHRQNQDQHYAIKLKNGKYVFVMGGLYAVLDAEQAEFKQLNTFFVNLFQDDEERIWLCSRYNGVFIFKDESLQDTLGHLLDGHTVTHVNRDFQGGYWISTFDGIFHYPFNLLNQNKIRCAERAVKKIINGPEGILFIQDEEGSVFEYKEGKTRKISYFSYEQNDDMNFINYDKTTSTLFTKNRDFKAIRSPEYQLEIRPAFPDIPLNFRSFDHLIFPDGRAYSLSHNKLFNWQSQKLIFMDKVKPLNKIYDGKIRLDTLWLATEYGIQFLSNDSLYDADNALLNGQSIVNMELGENLMCVAVKNTGLVVKSKHGQKLYNHRNGLFSVEIYDVLIDGNKLWIAGDDGLYVLDVYEQDAKVKKISQQQGLSSQSIYTIAKMHGQLFLGTDKEVVIWNISNLNQPVIQSKLLLKLNRVNGRNLKGPLPESFEYYENDLEIVLDAISFNDNENLKYSWQMEGMDKSWRTSEQAYLSFKKLSPGTYHLKARCSSLPGLWSEEASLTFTILPPFWLSWWFILLEFVVFISVIVFIYRWRSNRVKIQANREIEIIKEKTELEMKALRAQMNPHFIFNSLNSIAFLIVKGKNVLAEEYLLKFSKLLRSIINQSPQSMHLLSKEIEITTNYLELERLRFSNKFDFEIDVDPSVQIDKISVPSLILQPFVENAIVHGLINREEKGHLQLKILKEHHVLSIIIKDDGVGREKAMELKKRKAQFQQSVGISNSKNRLDLINLGLENEVMSLKISDLYNENKEACGTEVTLKMVYT